MKLAYRNLVRHYRKSILSAAIGIVTIALLLLYAVNLDSTERQLASGSDGGERQSQQSEWLTG